MARKNPSWRANAGKRGESGQVRGNPARLVEDTDAGGERTTYSYNRLSQKVSETSTGGKSIIRSYDDAGHLLTIDDRGTGVSSVFGYNANEIVL